jgi:hypothetical protein
MRVFVLCTGRSGSTAFVKACQHIDNFTAGHETNAKVIGKKRFSYPDQHIEVDNRLSWFLGTLDEKFNPNKTLYVHLRRDLEETVNSFMRRFKRRGSIVSAFARGVYMTPIPFLDDAERRQVCIDYVNAVNKNIELFLENKPNKMEIHLDRIKEEFPEFLERIDAEVDLEDCLNTFDVKHNNASQQKNFWPKYELKILAARVRRAFSN